MFMKGLFNDYTCIIFHIFFRTTAKYHSTEQLFHQAERHAGSRDFTKREIVLTKEHALTEIHDEKGVDFVEK